MKFSTITNVLISASLAGNVSAYAPNHSRRSTAITTNISTSSQTLTRRVPASPLPQSVLERSSPLLAQSTENEDGFFSNLTINPSYAAFYLLFFSVATYMTNTEASGASQALIEKFIADPLHPGFGSSLFESVWNAIGLVGLPLACVIMPGAKGQKLNPTPFLFASSLAGYGSLGIFMSTRTPVPSVDKEDLGWFTKNVLENKIFNWALFAILANAYVISGAAEGLLTNTGGTLHEFKEMIGGSALGITTTVDFSILCLTGASLVPEDLKRRGIDDDGKAYAIAASTLLVPAAGLALYSALRPSLDEE